MSTHFPCFSLSLGQWIILQDVCFCSHTLALNHTPNTHTFVFSAFSPSAQCSAPRPVRTDPPLPRPLHPFPHPATVVPQPPSASPRCPPGSLPSVQYSYFSPYSLFVLGHCYLLETEHICFVSLTMLCVHILSLQHFVDGLHFLSSLPLSSFFSDILPHFSTLTH